MSIRLILPLPFLLAGCASHPTPEDPARPAESTVAEAPEEPKAAATAMADTGVLDEEAFAKLHQLEDEQAPAPRGKMIEVAGARAYLSLPEDASPPLPGVVVIHEWWGLNDHIKHWTDRLAADGYAAIAVDLYGGEVATDPEGATALMKAVDEARSKEILAAAHEMLAQDPRIQAGKRGVIGWCFGGGWSLQHALSVPGLDAAVLYYGRLETDPKVLEQIEAPVLGIFGNQDEGIPPQAVDAFAAAMKEADQPLQLERYDAPHAFANPSSERYVPQAAEDAWAKTRAFLAEHLK